MIKFHGEVLGMIYGEGAEHYAEMLHDLLIQADKAIDAWDSLYPEESARSLSTRAPRRIYRIRNLIYREVIDEFGVGLVRKWDMP